MLICMFNMLTMLGCYNVNTFVNKPKMKNILNPKIIWKKLKLFTKSLQAMSLTHTPQTSVLSISFSSHVTGIFQDLLATGLQIYTKDTALLVATNSS